MHVRRAVIVMLALVAAVAGCGGGSTGASDADRVAATVSDYLRLQAEGEPAKACELLTPAGRRALVAFVTEEAKSLPIQTEGLTCDRAIDLVRLAAGTELLTAMRDAKVEDVRITGDRAAAEVVGAGDVGRRTVELERAGGDWRIRAVPGLGD